jgi:hypothetical protein
MSARGISRSLTFRPAIGLKQRSSSFAGNSCNNGQSSLPSQFGTSKHIFTSFSFFAFVAVFLDGVSEPTTPAALRFRGVFGEAAAAGSVEMIAIPSAAKYVAGLLRYHPGAGRGPAGAVGAPLRGVAFFGVAGDVGVLEKFVGSILDRGARLIFLVAQVR